MPPSQVLNRRQERGEGGKEGNVIIIAFLSGSSGEREKKWRCNGGRGRGGGILDVAQSPLSSDALSCHCAAHVRTATM